MLPLTERETAVVRLMTSGLSNREISSALGIKTATVKNHSTAIFRKWRVNDRTQAAVVAFARGIITPQEAYQQMTAYMRERESM